MDLLDFEQIGDRAFYRPKGKVTLEEAIELGAQAMLLARERGCTDMLLDTRGLSGFPSPSVVGRFEFAVRWARSASGQLRVAFVVSPEMMDPGKIAMLIGGNRGAVGDAFIDEADALAWLESRDRKRPA